MERARLREGQILFTYLHLAPDPDQTHDLINSGCVAIAYETVTDGARWAAAAGADERGRRPDVDPGRRAFARDGEGRLRGSAYRVCPACNPARSW